MPSARCWPSSQASSHNPDGVEHTRRIGFFGGSFNPIHNGHLALGRHLLAAAGLDEVWFVVSPQNPLKPAGGLLDDLLRLEMVRAALDGEPSLHACDAELSMPRPSYTWNTLCRLSAENPQCEFTLLIGGDNWAGFADWYRHEDIAAGYRIVVYPRRGAQVDAASMPAGVTLKIMRAGKPATVVLKGTEPR